MVSILTTLADSEEKSFYFPVTVVGMLFYWIILRRASVKVRRKTHKLRHYYICNVTAYVLFLAVAALAFTIGRNMADFPTDLVYYPMFRLSYAIALIGDRVITPDEIPLSFSIFYIGTLLILMVKPLFTMLSRKLEDRLEKQEAERKHKRRKHRKRTHDARNTQEP